jgi:hypothetical protein
VNEAIKECDGSGGKRRTYCVYAKFNPKIQRMGDFFMTLFTTAHRKIALYFSKLIREIGEIFISLQRYSRYAGRMLIAVFLDGAVGNPSRSLENAFRFTGGRSWVNSRAFSLCGG